MSENLADVTDNMDVHIEAVITHLNQKFPHAGPERVREIVQQVFAELEAEAAVPDHLPALTQHRAQDRLVAEVGHHETGPAGAEDRATRPPSPEAPASSPDS